MEHYEDYEVVPYADQPTEDLIYIRAILKQKDTAVPTDLDATLAERGVLFDD